MFNRQKVKLLLCFAVLLSVLSLGVGTAAADGPYKMYWTVLGEGAKIQRANSDGSGVEDLIAGPGTLWGLRGIALDVAGGKMYWAELGGKIQRANLDGSGFEDLVTGLGYPHGIALDVVGGKMYWTDHWTGKIQRANLDGSGVEDLVTGLGNGPRDIALLLPIGYPVGGVVVLVDKLGLVAPRMGLMGMVGLAALGLVAARRCRG